jgi:hypothetical protein
MDRDELLEVLPTIAPQIEELQHEAEELQVSLENALDRDLFA